MLDTSDVAVKGFPVAFDEDQSIVNTLTLSMIFGVLNVREGQTGFINMNYYD